MEANPAGGTVSQGAASFNASGAHLTITTSASTAINWQSFNIGAGETTTFMQPSASSVVWNQINDPNPSQILGTLNANGFVVLQNSAGFYVGGGASLTTHGLVMTTTPTPAPTLADGGSWSFNTPPPTAKIINYGQINITGGGQAYLIANDIENNGTISAPGGTIGLYAGKTVLMSMSPDGRGLSAQVTLPQGSVDNNGRLIADGGTIAAQAQTVNQGGLVQANSVQEVNGTIELVAGDALNLSASSIISAQGDSTGVSDGGAVTLKSGNTFVDQAGSMINVSGGAQGGNGGLVGICAVQMGDLQSTILGRATAGFTGGRLTIDPTDITIDDGYAATLNSEISGGLSSISLTADNNIEISTLWQPADLAAPGTISLSAGNNITIDDGAGIQAGNNWSISLTAGTGLGNGTPVSGSDGIYLNGSGSLHTENGDITLWAGNEVQVGWSGSSAGTGIVNAGTGSITTTDGGNISVATVAGDINTGGDIHGYIFGLGIAPYYRVNTGQLGGISTAAGGNVTLAAGGDVLSYLPTQYDYNNNGAGYDGGTGAFGTEPGNVTVTAGGNISGNYVLANGVGSITADGMIGLPLTGPLSGLNSQGFALSLVKGNWSVYAPNIYLDDVMNPNGVFNDAQNGNAAAGAHLFDYDPNASVLLDGANSVEITGGGVPLLPASDVSNLPLPILLPPSLKVMAGAGGFVLDTTVITFPSPNGNINITTTAGGSFISSQNPNDPQNVNTYSLQMSDSSKQQWNSNDGNNEGTEDFGYSDHAATPQELNNPNPVDINISGNVENVNIYTTKETDLTVGGNMFNVGFVGENLHAGDVTTINVTGSITYSPIYSLTTLAQPIAGVNSLNPYWNSIFTVLADNTPTDNNYIGNPIPSQDIGNLGALRALALNDLAFPSSSPVPGNFIYNLSTLQLGYTYQMSSAVLAALTGTLEMIQRDGSGNPEYQLGQTSLGQEPSQYYFVTTPVSFVPPAAITALYNESQTSVQNAQSLSTGLQIGGPGQFVVKAGSLDLGASGGIVSWGGGDGAQSVGGGINYAALDTLTGANGADVTVDVAGNIGMITSTIATIGGGDVTVNSTGGEIDLGLADLSFAPPNNGNLAYGIYASAIGNVSVTANNDVNIDTARIATFNGGNVTVESLNGDVNAGNGVNEDLNILVYYPDSALDTTPSIQSPRPYGSGILAQSPTADYQIPGTSGLPGNIIVTTPNGNIVSTLGGISQFALDGNIAGGPTVTLTAGTVGVTATPSQGNIDLGNGGVIGGTVNLTAQGNINGLIVSRQNTTVTAQQNVDVTVLSAGSAAVSGGGTVSGDIVAVGGASVSGESVTAGVFSDSGSVNGGAAQSTLGTATASTAATSAGAAAAQTTTQAATTPSGDDLNKKRKPQPLVQRVKRVTVILPGT